MKNFFKNEKGISLISLGVTIIVLVIITTIFVYNARDNVDVKKLKNLYNDIGNLSDKISSYYSEYGTIPILKDKSYDAQHDSSMNNAEYTNTQEEGTYYVIDLSAMDGLTLYYGNDYEKVKSGEITAIDSTCNDLFIVNDVSHNVLYIKGVQVNGKMYYSDVKYDPVVSKINRYIVDGIEIPSGCEYVSGTNKSDLRIREKETGIEFVWRDASVDVELNDEANLDSFLKSKEIYNGYFYDETNNTVLFRILKSDSGIVDVYDSSDFRTAKKTVIEPEMLFAENSMEYTDINGDIVHIPANSYFLIDNKANTVRNGFMISCDNGTYIWIPVPKSITEECIEDDEIEEALKEYAADYQKDGYSDTYFNGCGLSEGEYNKYKSAMLQGIKEYGGFYIEKIEARTNSNNISNIRNNISCSSAMQEIKNSTSTISLMFGIQWDLMCKYFETYGILPQNKMIYGGITNGMYKGTQHLFDIKSSDSISVLYEGNSSYRSFTRGSYLYGNLIYKDANYVAEIGGLADIYGNVSELTLENDGNGNAVARGSNSSKTNTEGTLAERESKAPNTGDFYTGYRRTLLLKPVAITPES